MAAASTTKTSALQALRQSQKARFRLTLAFTDPIASDVLIAVLIASICAHAVWFRTSVALIIILVLSLVGFTTAVGLARLITGATARERSFLEAEARAAYLNDPVPQATTGAPPTP